MTQERQGATPPRLRPEYQDRLTPLELVVAVFVGLAVAAFGFLGTYQADSGVMWMLLRVAPVTLYSGVSGFIGVAFCCIISRPDTYEM